MCAKRSLNGWRLGTVQAQQGIYISGVIGPGIGLIGWLADWIIEV